MLASRHPSVILTRPRLQNKRLEGPRGCGFDYSGWLAKWCGNFFLNSETLYVGNSFISLLRYSPMLKTNSSSFTVVGDFGEDVTSLLWWTPQVLLQGSPEIRELHWWALQLFWRLNNSNVDPLVDDMSVLLGTWRLLLEVGQLTGADLVDLLLLLNTWQLRCRVKSVFVFCWWWCCFCCFYIPFTLPT